MRGLPPQCESGRDFVALFDDLPAALRLRTLEVAALGVSTCPEKASGAVCTMLGSAAHRKLNWRAGESAFVLAVQPRNSNREWRNTSVLNVGWPSAHGVPDTTAPAIFSSPTRDEAVRRPWQLGGLSYCGVESCEGRQHPWCQNVMAVFGRCCFVRRCPGEHQHDRTILVMATSGDVWRWRQVSTLKPWFCREAAVMKSGNGVSSRDAAARRSSKRS